MSLYTVGFKKWEVIYSYLPVNIKEKLLQLSPESEKLWHIGAHAGRWRNVSKGNANI